MLEQILSDHETQLANAAQSGGGSSSTLTINTAAGKARKLRAALGLAGCECSLCTKLSIEFSADHPAAWANTAPPIPDNDPPTSSDNSDSSAANGSDDASDQDQNNPGAANDSDDASDQDENNPDDGADDDDGTQNRGRTICQPADFPVAGFELLIMPSTGNEFGSLVGKWKGAEVTVQGADKKGQGGIAKIRFCSGNSCNRNRSMCNSCRKSYER